MARFYTVGSFWPPAGRMRLRLSRRVPCAVWKGRLSCARPANRVLIVGLDSVVGFGFLLWFAGLKRRAALVPPYRTVRHQRQNEYDFTAN
jgi:hypothetical protein